MKVSRRKPPSSAGPVDADDRLGRLAPMHIDYDEARSSEERETYHQSRLLARLSGSSWKFETAIRE
jgi:hypothetical protein